MSTAPKLYTKPGEETLKALVAQPAYATRFNQVLGDRAPQFVSSLLSVGASMYDVEPKSIIAAAMIAAALNLPIDKNLGFAWIVPYRDGERKYASCQIGWKGFVQLAMRSGYYDDMNAQAINAEAFKGFDRMGNAIIDWNLVDADKPPVGYAFAWKLRNASEPAVRYWKIEKVRAHAQRYSQAYRKNSDTPWKTHFDQMAIKTVVKNELSDWGLLSIEFQTALKADQGVVKDIDAEVEYLDNPREKPDHKPKLEGPAVPEDDQVPGAEKPLPEPAAAQSATEAGIAAPTEPQDVPDLDKPWESVQRFMQRDGVSEDQLLAYMRKLKYAKKDQKLSDLAADKFRDIAAHWKGHLAKIKAQPAEGA